MLPIEPGFMASSQRKTAMGMGMTKNTVAMMQPRAM